MNIFQKIFSPGGMTILRKKSNNAFSPIVDYFNDIQDIPHKTDSYLCNVWVNIAVGILTRNIARAGFTLVRGGEAVTSGPLYELFRRPNEGLSRFDLWKETAAWWYLEGEACDRRSLRWFGPDYAGGIPKELYILDPRGMRCGETELGDVAARYSGTSRRWFYEAGAETIPIFSDELIHFRDWNPWNPVRGINPLVALALELEQDYYANKANSQLLKNNAIPQGILKTEQTLRPEEADQIERRWESCNSAKPNCLGVLPMAKLHTLILARGQVLSRCRLRRRW
jgi:HK97 family phage portal protein